MTWFGMFRLRHDSRKLFLGYPIRLLEVVNGLKLFLGYPVRLLKVVNGRGYMNVVGMILLWNASKEGTMFVDITRQINSGYRFKDI